MRKGYEDRAVFFVCPTETMKEQIVDRIFKQEFVVYIVDDLTRMEVLAQRFDDAIIYINIDQFYKVHNDNQVWKQAIASMFANNESKNLRIGVITNQNSPTLKKICMLECYINSTYIMIDKGYTDAFEAILATLNVYNVKGRRRYVRAVCKPEDNVTFSIEIGGMLCIADVDDISSASASVRFRDNFVIPGKDHYKITLSFNGDIIEISGTYFGVRSVDYEGKHIKRSIFMFDFDLNGPPCPERQQIYERIYSLLQNNIV